MVKGIPIDLDPWTASNKLLRVFKRTYYDQVLSVKVVGEYDKMLKLGEKWTRAQAKYEYYSIKNRENLQSGD